MGCLTRALIVQGAQHDSFVRLMLCLMRGRRSSRWEQHRQAHFRHSLPWGDGRKHTAQRRL